MSPPENESGPREVELPRAKMPNQIDQKRKDVAQFMPYDDKMRNVCANTALHAAHAAAADRTAKGAM